MRFQNIFKEVEFILKAPAIAPLMPGDKIRKMKFKMQLFVGLLYA
jgi:hypothetical protein